MNAVRCFVVIALIAAACGDNISPPGPGDVPPLEQCTVKHPAQGPVYSTPNVCPRATPDETCGGVVDNTGSDYRCSCDADGSDYGGKLPNGVFDADQTTLCDVSGCPSAHIGGCRATDLLYAFPDCALVAEVSGTVGGPQGPSGDIGIHEDGDLVASLCPDDPTTMRPDPFMSPQDLRTQGNFNGCDDCIHAIGAIHTEVQSCRYFNGTYALPGPTGQKTIACTVPDKGDLISAVGDWVIDFGHANWSEIHEARLMAKTVQAVDDAKTYFLMINAFFTAGTRQESDISLDIEVPKPTQAPTNDPLCKLMNDGGIGLAGVDPNMTGCALRDDVKVMGLVGNVNSSVADFGYCHVELVSNHLAFANAVNGIPWYVPANDLACTDELSAQCGYTGPVFSGRSALPGGDQACAPIAFAGTVQATWDAPGDLYLCDCACDDPSKAGSTITTRVQGCAAATPQMGPQAICDEACGGVVCTGAEAACDIGACRATPIVTPPSLVATSVCDTDHQPFVRVAPDGNYRTDIDPSSSTVTFQVDDVVTGKIPVNGALHFNLSSGTPRLIEFSDIDLRPDNFSIKGQSVTDAAIVTVERVHGIMYGDSSFEIPPGIGVFAARAHINGDREGVQVVNPEAIVGSVDFSSVPARFVLDIHATDPTANRSMTAHLEGVLDNLPPHADTSKTLTKVECTGPTLTPVTLDGTASYDTDPADFVSHYQWFHQALGISNEAVAHTSLPLGMPTTYTLHVYDRELGADMASTSVTVVDTTPPSLAISPATECLWPPDHKMQCFTLGADITWTATDTCDPNPSVRIASVTSNQPTFKFGSGNTSGDYTWTDTGFCVRRERSAVFGPRTYTVDVVATDHSGNSAHRNVLVTIPMDQAQGCH